MPTRVVGLAVVRGLNRPALTPLYHSLYYHRAVNPYKRGH